MTSHRLRRLHHATLAIVLGSAVGALDPELGKDVTKGTFRSTFASLESLAKIDLRGTLASLTVPTLSIGSDGDALHGRASIVTANGVAMRCACWSRYAHQSRTSWKSPLAVQPAPM